jgi:DNA-binding NarL/FixJ family response regulator
MPANTLRRSLEMERQLRRKTLRTPDLTPRQKQILYLIAEGLTSREIAEELAISAQTVEVHRFNLMRRLGVRNVAQLIRQAHLLRFLPQK